MKIKIATFSHKGTLLALRLKEILNIDNSDIAFFNELDFNGYNLKEWVKAAFIDENAIIFVGAAQIAVRVISPFINSKLTDPAVIVIDDCGKFCIPILSGHLGGANSLALSIAKQIGALPIITTATDINHIFAIDSWCKKNNFKIKNSEKIKNISSALLNGRKIKMFSDYRILGELPQNILKTHEEDYDVIVSCKSTVNDYALHIVPPIITVGCGCKKMTKPLKFKSCYYEFLEENNISPLSIKNFASVDLKTNEPAITELAKELKLPFITFSPAELKNACGEFSASKFVFDHVGVDNVCERSAVLAYNGNLIVKKTIYGGITFAAATIPLELKF